MIESHIRPKLQPMFDKMGTIIVPVFSPNTITFFAFILGITSAICIATHHMYWGLLFLLFSGTCDVLDGTVARLNNQSSNIGAYIDLIVDRMVEAAVILGFMIAYPEYYVAYTTFFVAVLLHFSTFLAAGALFENTGEKSIHYDRSIVERAEAFIVFAIMIMLPEYLNNVLLCFNGIVFLSGISRFFRVVRAFS